MHLKPLTSPRIANWLAAVIMAGVPFTAFVTAWLASVTGHYTLLRLWPELLLLVATGFAGWWLTHDAALRRWLFGSLLFRLLLLYTLLTLLLGVVALVKGEVTPKALGYGVDVNLRFLLFFVDVSILSQRSAGLKRHWRQLLFWPAACVAAFAVLQFAVLPHDFLYHFGYGPHTIAPIETINNDPHHIRAAATLRGANPLGAYLVVVLAAVTAVWSIVRRRLLYGVLAADSLLALVFTFSRSAWIGTLAAVGIAGWMQLPSGRPKKRTAAAAAVLAAAAILGFFLLRHSGTVQDALFHTNQQSTVAVSSNQAHASALHAGLDDVVHEPLGRGPGTAGPASAYNTGHNARIAENYFVQIAQEVGWAGLLLLLAIMAIVALELFRAAQGSRLALALAASFAGLTLVNMLSHAWTDPTLAYIWWGLAGVALSPVAPPRKQRRAKHV